MPGVVVFPPDAFNLKPGEVNPFGESPSLNRIVDWFIKRMTVEEWGRRRERVARRYLEGLAGIIKDERGTFYDEADLFSWYLFCCEAFLRHPWNYEYAFGARILPVLGTVGDNLDRLLAIPGFIERADALIHGERSQPNGALFEMLVAAAYSRDGWAVSWRPTIRGGPKSHDLDIEKAGLKYAVECKRFEGGGDYAEDERMRMRKLWRASNYILAPHLGRSALTDVTFNVEIRDVPEDYLTNKTMEFIYLPRPNRYEWSDDVGSGFIRDLDLSPVQEVLSHSYLRYPSPRLSQLLTGDYRRYDNLISTHKMKHGPSSNLLDQISLSVVMRWATVSQVAVEKRARDVHSKLKEANSQLPSDRPGIVHIGFESLSGDAVDKRRYEKVVDRVASFDKSESRLEWVFCHYFAPETSPEVAWAMDETVHWMMLGGQNPNPLVGRSLLTINPESRLRDGVHWEIRKG